MRSGDRGEVEIISPCPHDVLLKPDSVLRSRRIPLTKLLNLSCDCRCYTMFSKCDLFSEVPVLAISGVVDTSSTSMRGKPEWGAMNLGEPVEDVVETLTCFKMKNPIPLTGLGFLTNYLTGTRVVHFESLEEWMILN